MSDSRAESDKSTATQKKRAKTFLVNDIIPQIRFSVQRDLSTARLFAKKRARTRGSGLLVVGSEKFFSFELGKEPHLHDPAFFLTGRKDDDGGTDADRLFSRYGCQERQFVRTNIGYSPQSDDEGRDGRKNDQIIRSKFNDPTRNRGIVFEFRLAWTGPRFDGENPEDEENCNNQHFSFHGIPP